MTLYARETDIIIRQCEQNPLDNTSDEVPKLQVEEPTSFWTKLQSPSTQRASRGQRALGGPPSACAWVWFHAKVSPRELESVDCGTAREIFVRRWR